MQLFKLTSHQQCTSDLSLNQGSLFNPNKNRNSSIKTQGGYTLWSLLSKEKIKTWNGNSLESQIQCSPTYSTRQDLNHANKYKHVTSLLSTIAIGNGLSNE